MPCPRVFLQSRPGHTMGRDEKEIEAILEAMADKGLCLALSMDQSRVYQAARFMAGILEFQFMPGKTTDRDKKIAELIHAYEKAFDKRATGQNLMSFPTTRVITVDALVKSTIKSIPMIRFRPLSTKPIQLPSLSATAVMRLSYGEKTSMGCPMMSACSLAPRPNTLLIDWGVEK